MSTSQEALVLEDLDIWVGAHHPDPSLSYGKGWWDGIEFVQVLRDRNGLEAVDVAGTYMMATPPPCEMLLMRVYRIAHQGMECYLKTDFGLLPPNWFLSVRIPARLVHTYGLFDPARDWRRESRCLDGFREEWRYPAFSENPLCFTCAVDAEWDVYMLVRLLIGMPSVSDTTDRSLSR
jgi:hypothetical protein